jgi:hypothetical protein
MPATAAAAFLELCSTTSIVSTISLGKARLLLLQGKGQKAVCVLCVGVISTICMSYMRHQ